MKRNQKIRRRDVLAVHHLKNVIAHLQELGNLVFHPQPKVLHIIIFRIHQPVLVKARGIGGKYALVRFPQLLSGIRNCQRAAGALYLYSDGGQVQFLLSS